MRLTAQSCLHDIFLFLLPYLRETIPSSDLPSNIATRSVLSYVRQPEPTTSSICESGGQATRISTHLHLIHSCTYSDSYIRVEVQPLQSLAQLLSLHPAAIYDIFVPTFFMRRALPYQTHAHRHISSEQLRCWIQITLVLKVRPRIEP